MIEFEGLRLLAALKYLVAASFLPDLNSTIPTRARYCVNAVYGVHLPSMIQSFVRPQRVHEALTRLVVFFILRMFEPL
jgi:hypothetical protein